MTPKAFQKLQREWYARLALETDFVDIEKGGLLKTWECYRWVGLSKTKPIESIQSDFEYYQLATEFLNEWGPIFMTELDWFIWQRHSEAIGVREIAEQLKAKGHHTNKDVVAQAIKDIKAQMFVVMNVA